MTLQGELQRESTWCCSVIPSADVKILVLPGFQPGTELYSPLSFSWCGCKSPRLWSRTNPRFVAPMLRSILLNYSMNRVWSDFPETSANAEERLLLVVAQFDLFSRHLFLSSEVVADSQFPRRASGFNFSAGVCLSGFGFAVVLCWETAWDMLSNSFQVLKRASSSFLELFLFYVLQWTLWLISITKQHWQCFFVP